MINGSIKELLNIYIFLKKINGTDLLIIVRFIFLSYASGHWMFEKKLEIDVFGRHFLRSLEVDMESLYIPCQQF